MNNVKIGWTFIDLNWKQDLNKNTMQP